MEQDTEQELVARSRRGDLGAFNRLVERYQAQAYGVAVRMLGDHALAEDAIQEAILSAYRALGRFRGGSFRAWLLRITSNAALDILRSRKRHASVSLDNGSLALDAVLPSGEESPEEYTLRRELGREIQEGLATLTPEQRLTLVLVDIQGLDYQEAAQVAGVSLGTIKSRLSRARGALRDYLTKRPELLPAQFRQSK